MSEGGCITLATRPGGPPDTARPGVIIEMTDTGVGIAAKVLPHIFDLFMTTKETGKGTGLGLAVCQEIIKGHEGTIAITSEVNKGTRVHVFLPTDEQRILPLMPKDIHESAYSHHG